MQITRIAGQRPQKHLFSRTKWSDKAKAYFNLNESLPLAFKQPGSEGYTCFVRGCRNSSATNFSMSLLYVEAFLWSACLAASGAVSLSDWATCFELFKVELNKIWSHYPILGLRGHVPEVVLYPTVVIEMPVTGIEETPGQRRLWALNKSLKLNSRRSLFI